MTGRRKALACTLLILSAMLFRLALIVQAGGCRQDPDNYLPLARSLAAGKGFVFNKKPTAYRPPLYPLMLAPLVAASPEALPWTVGALHVLLGGLTVGLTGAFVRRASTNPVAPWVAMAVVAFDPVLAVQSRGVMTETLAAALTALSLWGISLQGKKGAFLGGLGFGLSVLCRPSLMPGAILVAFARMTSGGERLRDWLLDFVIFAFSLLAVLAPWTIRNWLVLGAPVWATTHGGYTLSLANNPFYFADVLEGPPGAVWSGENQEIWASRIYRATMTLSEPEADHAIREGAIAFMWAHPEQTLRASVARLGRFWGISPSGAVYARSLQWMTAVWTVPFWILTLTSLFGREIRRWPLVASFLVILALTSVHSLFWTDLRMRAPIVPALAALAGSSPLLRLKKRPDVQIKAVENP